MIKVSNPIVLEWAGGDAPWLIHSPITFQDDICILEVPRGFKTDLASVPRFLWSIIPPYGKYTQAAIVHDYLYATGLVSRVRADAIFLSIMRARNVPLWKRTLMYLAVRAFGWRSFKAVALHEKTR